MRYLRKFNETLRYKEVTQVKYDLAKKKKSMKNVN